jgi:type IV pilus secretin PilQ/predicted competence protein
MTARRPFIIIFILMLVSTFGPARQEVRSASPIGGGESDTSQQNLALQVPGNSEIIYIGVNAMDGTTEIEIQSSSSFKYAIYKPSDPYHIIVDLQDTKLGNFRDKMVYDKAGVMEITPIRDVNAARLDISLTVPVNVEPVYEDNTLILAFDNPDAVDVAAGTSEEYPLEEVGVHETDGDAFKEIFYDREPEEEPVREKQYTGEKISIDFQDAELIHVFRLISDISGYNIVVSPDVKGNFSMKLTDVPWDQALDVILRNYGLSKSMEGNIIRVAPTSVLAKEEEEIARAKESQEKAGDLVTKVYAINYAQVKDTKKAIEDAKILTKRGFISTDERTSSVIIKDVEDKHSEHARIIKAIDIPTPQVNIDARIVEVRHELTKDLGIQWGMFWQPPDSRMTIGGVSGLAGGSGFNSGNALMVNLPAIVGAGKGGNLGIGYINASQTFKLDLQLSALESTGKAKVVSNPKITTSDNQEAKIMQGEKIPYQTVSQDGTQTQFIDAFLELTVTPHITPEGTIVMNIEAKKNEADFTRQVLGVPTIAIKEVKTQVLISNNDTLVIGGIFTSETTKNLERVPGFSDIPIMGRLFQKDNDIEDKNELLIFITPRIVTPTKG